LEFCVLSFSGFLDFFCGRFIRPLQRLEVQGFVKSLLYAVAVVQSTICAHIQNSYLDRMM
jgi:hypothetical protein